MKANELRIGNWVEQPNDGVTRVTAILNDLQIKTETGYIDKYCRPIPLTEEWLLKFGFIENKHGYLLNGFRIKEYVTGFFYGYIPVFLDNIDEDIDDVKITYVHQLQNLYFALTGEELTLNEKQDA